VNKAIISGNLGRDPELKTAASGTAVCQFSLATKDRAQVDGKWTDVTEWHNVVCFGKTAELCSEYLRKGSKALVEGSIKSRKWTGKDGVEKTRTEIVAQSVEFLSERQGGGGFANASAAAAPKPQARRGDDFTDDFSGDVPF
jgi:single-strand DNA-binding protein